MYRKLANYYKYIFPSSQVQKEFFRKLFNDHEVETVLDVACGTGEQMEGFAEMGLKVHGFELEEAMVEIIREKPLCRSGDITVKSGNMLETSQLFPGPYDAVICIGNSLVHLKDTEEISRAIKSMVAVLRPGGLVVIQIVNYDRILDNRVTSLGPIETEDDNGTPITFERAYDLSTLPNAIQFNTTLRVGNQNRSSSIPLFPLRSNQLLELAAEAGFIKPRLFGGYDRSPFSQQTEGCILAAIKKE